MLYVKMENQLLSYLPLTLRANSSGEPIGYTIISHNQTELNSKLQALAESKEYTRSLIESNLDVLVTTDSLGIINDVNQQICEMTEFSSRRADRLSFQNVFY